MHFGANALEACFLAEGRMDGFVDVRGRIRVMDMAAGLADRKQAGAVFSDERGGPLTPGDQRQGEVQRGRRREHGAPR